jgi:iron(III) transport system permease protein
VPSIVFGLGALLISLFVTLGPIDLYGSLLLLLVVYCIVQLSFATRVTNSALISIQVELEEAAATSGASTFMILRSVIFPLLRPAILYGWLWLALLTVRELTLATMLFSASNVTLSVVVWSLWSSGQLGSGAAVSMILLAILLPLVLLYWKFGGAGRSI